MFRNDPALKVKCSKCGALVDRRCRPHSDWPVMDPCHERTAKVKEVK